MNPEFPKLKKELPDFKQLEISLNSKEDLAKLEGWLQNIIGKEEAQQCVFVLHSMAEMDFINQCQDATKELGKRLATQFGEEESFFELAPHANFSDIQSSVPVDKLGYRIDRHSVGLLEFNSPNRQSFSLVIDLTYGTVSGKSQRDSILVLYSQGNKEKVLNVLKNHYGGLWKIAFNLDKSSKNFVFQEEFK